MRACRAVSSHGGESPCGDILEQTFVLLRYLLRTGSTPMVSSGAVSGCTNGSGPLVSPSRTPSRLWRRMARKKEEKHHPERPVSLKTLAEHLGLSPATISVVLNDVPGRSIPQPTRDRIKAAAKRLNYQPSLLARSLRSRQTHTIRN